MYVPEVALLSMMTIICPNCRHNWPEVAAYCGYCGAKVTPAEQAIRPSPGVMISTAGEISVNVASAPEAKLAIKELKLKKKELALLKRQISAQERQLRAACTDRVRRRGK